MSNPLGIVTVVNRTLEPLEGRWDGVPIDLPPGYRQREDGSIEPAGPDGRPASVQLPRAAARRIKWQHPQMGTADPDYPLDMEFRVAILEDGDDVGYLPDAETTELINRKLLGDQEAQEAEHITISRPAKRNRRAMYGSRNRNTVLKTKVDY